MRKLPVFLLCLVVLSFFSACENDFEVNADWKEVTIVYGLLEANKDTQYIRVNKAFLNENTSAIEIAQRMDSLYHNDSISVVLEEFVGGSFTRGIVLVRDTFRNKEPGDFHYPDHILYRTQPGVGIRTDAEYIVRVRNTASGNEAFAHTTVVAPLRHIYPTPTQQRINFSNYAPLQLNFTSGRNARFYDFEIVFHYTEYPPNNPSEAVEKTLVWPIFRYRRLGSVTGGQDMEVKLETEEFYKLLAQDLTADGMVREPGTVAFIYSAGGDEIYNYLTINQTSLGVVQKRADYTNINNGYGIFSSRLQEVLTMRLSDESLDSLVSGIHTSELGFTR